LREGDVDDEILPPASYVLRHPNIGRESTKVSMADGLRYLDHGNCDPSIDCVDASGITYNVKPVSNFKGIFTGTPPAVRNMSPSGYESREYTVARLYSYRHRRKKLIQALFFDGHVEGLLLDPSRKTADGGGFRGRAVDPKYYWPSGSVVREPEELHKDTIPVGTILP
jgi:prepilin-type processing-associated H-X9-DG protein